MVKKPASAGDTGDVGSIPKWARSSGGENGNPLQYSCLGNPIDRGTWRTIVCGVEKSWTQLSMHACSHQHSEPGINQSFCIHLSVF